MRSRRSHVGSAVALSFVLATTTRTIQEFMCPNHTRNVAQVDAYIIIMKNHPHHRGYSSLISLNLLAADLAAEEQEFHQERSNEGGNKNVDWHKSASPSRRQEESWLVEAATAIKEERTISQRKITKAGISIALPLPPSLNQKTMPSSSSTASRRRQCPPPTFTPTVTADSLEYWFHTLQGMEEEGILPPPRPKLLQSIRSKWKRLFPKEEVVQRYFEEDDDIFDHVDLNEPSQHQNMRPL